MSARETLHHWPTIACREPAGAKPNSNFKVLGTGWEKDHMTMESLPSRRVPRFCAWSYTKNGEAKEAEKGREKTYVYTKASIPKHGSPHTKHVLLYISVPSAGGGKEQYKFQGFQVGRSRSPWKYVRDRPWPPEQ